MPENWVEKDGQYCVLQRDYTATELNVDEGETVTVLLMESGWGWATNESGQSGWVPMECLGGQSCHDRLHQSRLLTASAHVRLRVSQLRCAPTGKLV